MYTQIISEGNEHLLSQQLLGRRRGLRMELDMTDGWCLLWVTCACGALCCKQQ